jgi:GDP-mannose 6-dehydrogenase
MRVSILGLGYVGCVGAACLARDGHTLIGIDINPRKVRQVCSGRSPIVEPGLDELIGEVVRSGKLQTTCDSLAAVHNSDISIICVGTPNNSNGSLDLQYVESVCRELGSALATKHDYHVIVIRSTVLPGTVQGRLIPLLEQHSHRLAGTDFGVCMHPEFLREGCAIEDYYHPDHIVIGELDQRSGDAVQQLYADVVEAPVVRTSIQTAEMVKYANNAFHALKVVFANEIGNLCKAHGIDGQEVMKIICQNWRLNLSAAYLKPGLAFGGSCLPKDLRAILYEAKEGDLEYLLLGALLSSIQAQLQRAVALVKTTGQKSRNSWFEVQGWCG